MLEGEQEPKSDPEFQLRALEKAMETASSHFSSLDSTIKKFATNFKSQESSLTTLYKKISTQQEIHDKIVSVRDNIVEIQNKLTTSEKLQDTLKLSVNKNFDEFMKAINEAIEAQQYLQIYDFEDANNERIELSTLIGSSEKKLLNYFLDLANRTATPIPLANFQFVDGKFILIDKRFENPIYPIQEELLQMMSQMASVLQMILCVDHIQDYEEARMRAIDESIEPIIDASNKRTVSAEEINVLDLPLYKKKDHPIHMFGYLVSFFFKREKEFAKKIFGEKYKGPFNNSFQPLFEHFKKTCVNVFDPELKSHVDVLFDVDIVSTIVEVLDSQVNDEDFSIYAVQLAQLSHMFHAGIERCLSNYRLAVEMNDPENIPANGSVIANVSNVIIFLNVLGQYKAGIEQVGGLSFELYIPSVLEALFKNIIEKSTRYTDIVLRQLFLMNNSHYVLAQIEQSPLLTGTIPLEFKEKLEKTMQDAQKVFLDETWNKAFQILAYDRAFDGLKKGDKLNKNQKKLIKDKFKKFKDAVLTIQMKQNNYCLKNSKLMEPIMTEAIQKTHTKFETFYTRWFDSGFASHPEKYTAVQPSTLEGIITRLYGPKKRKVVDLQ